MSSSKGSLYTLRMLTYSRPFLIFTNMLQQSLAKQYKKNSQRFYTFNIKKE